MFRFLFLICCIYFVTYSVTHGEEYAFDGYDYDAIIIGAGAAGIGAAQTLLQHSIDNILIIEAQGIYNTSRIFICAAIFFLFFEICIIC